MTLKIGDYVILRIEENYGYNGPSEGFITSISPGQVFYRLEGEAFGWTAGDLERVPDPVEVLGEEYFE